MIGSTPHRRVVLASALSLALAVLTLAPPVAGAAPACKVKNTTKGVSYGTFQKAVTKAKSGDRLELRGTCAGPIGIGKSLTIVGVKTKATGTPTLTGRDTTRVLRIRAGATVSLKGLVIRDGRAADSGTYPANSGAGILVDGRAILRNVVVRDNVAPFADAGAGGIEVTEATEVTAAAGETPSLVLAGTTVLRNNLGGWGGAIENYGRATIKDSVRIHHNQAQSGGGGIYNGEDLEIRGQVRIDHNTTPGSGGGIYNGDALTVQGTVVIDFNDAPGGGGGIYSPGFTCGANIRDNTPDDCG
jgi:hypothetical protein